METKHKLFNYLINLSFFLYFIILLVERIISVVKTFSNGFDIYSNVFFGYVYLLVFVSIIGWLIFLIIKCKENIKYLFKPSDDISFKNLCIASGILLLSGMVHTEYTIPIIQFISYGILIVGILLEVILNHKESNNKVSLWLSFVYLVCFSMAIPVMYYSAIKLHLIFHVLEGIASFTLVVMFTYLLVLLFEGESNLFIWLPIVVAVVLDIPLIILRWNEEINWFVLIFISLSTLMFFIGYIYTHKRKAR